MLDSKTIAVVVPAYNEEKQIGKVIESMPAFVDRIIIVNDNSSDGTANIVKQYINDPKHNPRDFDINPQEIEREFYNEADIVFQQMSKEEVKFFVANEIVNTDPRKDRIILINNLKNGGVGAGIARGYKWCKDNNIYCTCVMAGDGQMDPSELLRICTPVIYEDVDYVKGNRLIHRSAWLVIPKIRYFGNSILTILTKIASGYWRVSDTQTGYTAISLNAINAIRLYDIYRSYGMPNDMLVKMNIALCTLKEVPIKPVYGVGEQSKMKVTKVIPTITFLLLKSFFKRLWVKYLFRDFHPLFLLYNASFIVFFFWVPYLWKVGVKILNGEETSFETLAAFIFLGITFIQFFLFAMWMDIQDNDRLYK